MINRHQAGIPDASSTARCSLDQSRESDDCPIRQGRGQLTSPKFRSSPSLERDNPLAVGKPEGRKGITVDGRKKMAGQPTNGIAFS